VDPRMINDIGTYPNSNIPNVDGYPYVNQIQGDSAYHSQLAEYNGGFKITDDIRFYSFGTYGQKNAASYENYRLPSKVSYTNNGTTTYMYPYGFNPEESIEERDYSVTGGLKGEIAKWDWDLSTTQGNDHVKLFTLGSANAVVYSKTGASPVNFYDGLLDAQQWTTNLDFSRDFELGMAGPLNVAFGAEYRRESYTVGAGTPDSYLSGGAQSYPGFAPTDAGDHSRVNYAGYVDFAGKPIDKLYLDLAGRYEHYSDFGSTTVGKLTGRYDFTADYAVRGTISTGFRAPTLAEEYYSSTNVGPGTAFVQLPPNAAAAQLLGLGSGLRPEKSVNFSLGIVFHPIPKLTGTLDIYQTNIRNRIVGSGTLYGKVSGKTYSQAVVNAIIANGNQLDPDVVNNGAIGVNIFANGITTRTRGADLTLDYPTDIILGETSYGKVDWTIQGTYNQTSALSVIEPPSQLGAQPLFNGTAITDLTTASPRYVVSFGGLWTVNKFTVNLVEKIYGSSEEYQNDDANKSVLPIYRTRISPKPITNLDLGYQATKEIKLNVGAFNLFNEYPNHINSTVLANERDPSADDNAAVQIYPSFSPFGINGGFYYARATYSF
jgi:iron complex outermembrane receptor protein